jgi:Cu/Ag efflux pump CusA
MFAAMRARTIGIVIGVLVAAACAGLGVRALSNRKKKEPRRVEVAAATTDGVTAAEQIAMTIERIAPEHATHVESFATARGAHVTFFFDPKADELVERMNLVEGLGRVSKLLPIGATPELAPLQGIDVLHVAIEPKPTTTLVDLRTLADWTIQRALLTIPGIIDVDVCGGREKQIIVDVDDTRATAYGFAASEIATTIQASSLRSTSFAFGGYRSIEEITQVELKTSPPGLGRGTLPPDTPLRVSDVAQVRMGAANATCAAKRDGKNEIVLLAVRIREDVAIVAPKIAARLDELQRTETAFEARPIDFDRSHALFVRTSHPDVEPARVPGVRALYTYHDENGDPMVDATSIVVATEGRTSDVARAIGAGFARAGARFDITSPVEELGNDLRVAHFQILGPDLDKLAEIGREAEKAVREVHGAVGVGLVGAEQQPELKVEPDRAAVSRYGMRLEQVFDALAIVIGGRTVGTFYEGERRYDIVVRSGAPPSPDALVRTRLRTPDGTAIPLSAVANVREAATPRVILHSDMQRYVEVRFSVTGRNVVREAQKKLTETLRLPAGYLIRTIEAP